MVKKKRSTAVLVSMAMIALFMLVLIASLSGFSCAIDSLPSDEELVKSALRGEISQGNLAITNTPGAIQTFIANNPRCCRVAKPKKGGFIQSILNGRSSIFDSTPVSVRVIYEAARINTRTGVQRPGKYLEKIYLFNLCGEVKKQFSSWENEANFY